jgi:polyisoprenoid-binding protein YceI
MTPPHHQHHIMKITHTLTLATAIISLTACENPADTTKSAAVSEAVAVNATAATASAVTYTFAPESEISFVGSKVTGSHEGGFKSFGGEFSIANGSLAGTGQKITIDMNSIWSDSEKLTGHLKNEDFFNVEKYPQSTFELTSVKTGENNTYQVSGNLTLLETTKNITFPATVTINGETADIHAMFDINRKDFGVVYAGMSDDLIRDEVVIKLKLKATPKR